MNQTERKEEEEKEEEKETIIDFITIIIIIIVIIIIIITIMHGRQCFQACASATLKAEAGGNTWPLSAPQSVKSIQHVCVEKLCCCRLCRGSSTPPDP